MQTETENKNEILGTEQRLSRRPLWKRIVYPITGAVLIILGIIFWLVPIVPGFVLVIIGLPLFAGVNPRIGQWLRRQMRNIDQAVTKKFRKKSKLPKRN